MARQPLVDQGLLIVEASWAYWHTPQSVWTPLDEGSAHHRDLYLTIHNSQETDIHALEGLESAIPASERPQTHALDSAATGIGMTNITVT
jgi:hypothetical protein